MVLNTRQQEIMQILKAKGSVSVGELSTTLFASEMTIRRDLTEMEKGGFLRNLRKLYCFLYYRNYAKKRNQADNFLF